MSTELKLLPLVMLMLIEGTLLARPAEEGLFNAIKANDIEAYTKEIEEGANLKAFNSDGLTPLMLAAELGYENMVKSLLDHGAEVNASNEMSKMTALHVCAQAGHLNVTKLLIERGAVPTLKNSSGKTAYDLARSQRNALGVADYLRRFHEPKIEPRGRSNRENDSNGVKYRTLVEGVIKDANNVMLSVQRYDDLVESMGEIKKYGHSESRAWTSQRSTSYRAVMTAMERQLKAECLIIKDSAVKEQAIEVSQASDTLLKQWTERFALINEEMRRIRREERRQSMNRQREQRPQRDRGPEERDRDPQSNESEIDYDISDWLDSDMKGSEDLCTAVHEELMESYGEMLFEAEKSKAEKTLITTQAVVLERATRYGDILATFSHNNERNQRVDRGLRKERQDGRDRSGRGRN